MKQCGTDFMHQEWGITSGQSIKVRRIIPKDKLTIIDRQYKDHQYPTSISYCNGCILRVLETSSPKGNDRSPDNKQVFLNSSQVSTRFFQLVKGS